QFDPGVIHAMRKRPIRSNCQNPQNRRHAIQEKVVRARMCGQRADNEKHHALWPPQESHIALRNDAFRARARVTHHDRTHHSGAREKYVQRRMKLSVARVKDHQAHEHDHVRKAIKRRIKKTAETCYATRQPRHLAVQHVKQVRYDQNHAGPEEHSVTEQQSRGNVNSYADKCQEVRINVTTRQPTHHRIDDSLSCSSYTRSKHTYAAYLSRKLQTGRAERMIKTMVRGVNETGDAGKSLALNPAGRREASSDF